MNKMNYMEYTVPVGEECLVPSRVEALAVFNKLNLKGRIYFGIIYTDAETEVIGWVLKFRETICPLKTFQMPDERLGAVVRVTALNPGAIINYNYRYYLYAEDPVLQTALREITIFASEEDVINIRRSEGEEVEVIGLYKMNLIEDPTQPVFLVWRVRQLNYLENKFIPVFAEDAIHFRNHRVYDFNWVDVSPGYRIKHEGTTYQVYSRDLPNGGSELFINKAPHNPYMKILKT